MPTEPARRGDRERTAAAPPRSARAARAPSPRARIELSGTRDQHRESPATTSARRRGHRSSVRARARGMKKSFGSAVPAAAVASIPRDANFGRHGRCRLPRLTSLRRAPRAWPPRHLCRQPRDGVAAQRRAPPRRRVRVPQPRRDEPIRSTSRSTSSTTSRRSRARSTTCGCRCSRSRSARTAPTTRSGSRSGSAPASCSPRRARSTATRWCTRSPRRTGATSTRSVRAVSTTRRSATPRR